MSTTQETETLTFRTPRVSDAAGIWRLINRCPPLDVNSGYAYLLLCDHYADTCAVCESNGEIAGFVSGYLPPSKPDCLFIWQVAVDGQFRGKGLGSRMMRQILSRAACALVTTLETTVSPSNEASRRMFASLAKSLEGAFHEAAHYDAALIPEEGHESENLVTIGPFNAPVLS